MIEKLIEENIKSKCILSEARHYTGYSVERVSDGSIGKIVKSLIHGNAYEVEWENGKIQKLGRNTLTNDKKYILSLNEDEKIEKKSKFGKIYDAERQNKIRNRIDKHLEKMEKEKEWEKIANTLMKNVVYVTEFSDPILDDDIIDKKISNLRNLCNKFYKGDGKILVKYLHEHDSYFIILYDIELSNTEKNMFFEKLTNILKKNHIDNIEKYHGYNGLFLIKIKNEGDNYES